VKIINRFIGLGVLKSVQPQIKFQPRTGYSDDHNKELASQADCTLILINW